MPSAVTTGERGAGRPRSEVNLCRYMSCVVCAARGWCCFLLCFVLLASCVPWEQCSGSLLCILLLPRTALHAACYRTDTVQFTLHWPM